MKDFHIFHLEEEAEMHYPMFLRHNIIPATLLPLQNLCHRVYTAWKMLGNHM